MKPVFVFFVAGFLFQTDFNLLAVGTTKAICQQLQFMSASIHIIFNRRRSDQIFIM